MRGKEAIIGEAGYPYENYQVITDDGYILTLERLSRPESNRAVYFQHGVFDTSYAWIAKGPTGSIAMRAYDQGYDVFLGNFRGAADQGHIHEKISPRDYWAYTINHHGMSHALAQSDLTRSNVDIRVLRYSLPRYGGVRAKDSRGQEQGAGATSVTRRPGRVHHQCCFSQRTLAMLVAAIGTVDASVLIVGCADGSHGHTDVHCEESAVRRRPWPIASNSALSCRRPSSGTVEPRLNAVELL